MMEYPITRIDVPEIPSGLREIPDPPDTLYLRGNMPPKDATLLAVVGSRNYTNYGKEVTEFLIRGLRGYNIAIVSGLALGIDSIAHKAALETELYTLAVPGSGIDDRVLYPSQHRLLARTILMHGGGLLSEFEPTFQATPWSFPKRNRIMAGLSHATLVIEATEKSGSLITARLTAEYNRELLVVPGNIFSDASVGTHQFLKLGATPITSPLDILDALNIEVGLAGTPTTEVLADSPAGKLLSMLHEPTDKDELFRLVGLSPREGGVLLMQLELEGRVAITQNIVRKL